MTLAIDYPEAGEMSTQNVPPHAAGVDQGFNSYLQTQSDYPVHPELMEKPQEVAAPQPTEQDRNWAALRSEVDRIKADRDSERKDHQLQLEMLRANLAQTQQSREQPRPREMFAEQDPSYIPNVAELRQEMATREAAYQARLEELEFQTHHPDYAEVLQKYVAPLVKEKPHLAQGILSSSQRSAFAYELGKMAQQLQERQTVAEPAAPAVNQNAARMVENSRRPGSLSQTGGQSALSKADYYASMSDTEFMKFASRHLESI